MNVTKFIEWIPDPLIGVFIFFSSFMENIIPIYPGDTVTVFGAYLAGVHKISLWNVCLNVFFGSVSSGLLMYYLGERYLRYISQRAKWKWVQDLTNPQSLNKANVWFRKYGLWAVLISRFSAGVRFFISIIAGMSKMKVWIFVLSFSVATFLWNFLLIYAGYTLGNNWQQVLGYLKVYNMIILSILFFGISIFVVYKILKKRKQSL